MKEQTFAFETRQEHIAFEQRLNAEVRNCPGIRGEIIEEGPGHPGPRGPRGPFPPPPPFPKPPKFPW